MTTPEITNEWIDQHNQKLGHCKTPGCDQPPAQKRGPYAGLCTQHREERKAERNGTTKMIRPAPNRKQPTLAELATQIDEAHTHYISLVHQLRARLNQLEGGT